MIRTLPGRVGEPHLRPTFSSEGQEVLRKLGSLTVGLGNGPIAVHADLLYAGRIVERATARRALLEAHLALLAEFGADRLWLPTFNYAFTHTGHLDVCRDPSEVGALSEYFRTEVAAWRTATPVFSFAGVGPPPTDSVAFEVDPFGPASAFAELVRRDGLLLFYGALFASSTIKHHAERLVGGPLYRYDKRFPGTVTLEDGSTRALTLLYHVRPHGQTLTYDAPRLLQDAVAEGVLQTWLSERVRLSAISARMLVSFWSEKLRDDPLYLLDAPSRGWVEPLLDRLGRRFELSDFEGSV